MEKLENAYEISVENIKDINEPIGNFKIAEVEFFNKNSKLV